MPFDDRLGVGLEMFQRPFQKEIDRYFAGVHDEDAFLKASEYQKRWGYDGRSISRSWNLRRKNKLPLAALNASKELTARISRADSRGSMTRRKKQLGPIDFQLKEHRDYWYERLAKMHGNCGQANAGREERSYQVMTVWTVSWPQRGTVPAGGGLRRMVILAGSGHIDRGFWHPWRAARLTGGKALTVKIASAPRRRKRSPTSSSSCAEHAILLPLLRPGGRRFRLVDELL